MKRTSEQKAITLIALVITIIILLILAGISIQALTGTGLFGQAKRAKTVHEIAREIEQIKIAIMSEVSNTEHINTITFDGLKEELNKYKDVKNVEKCDSIPDGATKVSKTNKKIKLTDLFMTTSYAAENSEYEYAKVTYKSQRVYYVKVQGDKAGTIYEDPNNQPEDDSEGDQTGDTSEENQTGDLGGNTSDESQTEESNLPETEVSYFTYEYGNIEYGNTNNVNGWTITGFSEQGSAAALNNELTTVVFPKKYTGKVDGAQVEAPVVCIGGYATSGDGWDHVDKIIVPSTIKRINNCSLYCVEAYETQVTFEEGLEYVECGAFGSWSFNSNIPFVELPNSVVYVENGQIDRYSTLYLAVGKNLQMINEENCLFSDGIAGNNPEAAVEPCINILFFKGTLEELNENEFFTSHCEQELNESSLDSGGGALGYIYCLNGGKRAVQTYSEESGVYSWNEIENLSEYVQQKANRSEQEANDYVNSYINIETEALTHFK